MIETLFQVVKATSLSVTNERTLQHVVIKTMEEVGELSQEILIHDGVTTNKPPGKDGVVGEAIDAIITLLDIIHVHSPGITEEDLVKIAKQKCQKWLDYQ